MRNGATAATGPTAATRAPLQGDGTTGFVYIGVGRKAGVRPADLVGAVANETGIGGRDIGPIRISEHFSVVGVPAARVGDVVESMRSALVRGKPATARPWSDEPGPAGKPRTAKVHRKGQSGPDKGRPPYGQGGKPKYRN